MKIAISVLFAISLCFAEGSLNCLCFPEGIIKGIVQDVYDGDSFKLKVEGRIIEIRIYGIDAPERKGKQPHGKEAGDALRALIDGKEIRVRVIEPKDPYCRTIGEPWLGDSLDISLWMIKNGHAWWDIEHGEELIKFKEAQEEAKTKKFGLWADINPIAPWDFRKKKTEKN